MLTMSQQPHSQPVLRTYQDFPQPQAQSQQLHHPHQYHQPHHHLLHHTHQNSSSSMAGVGGFLPPPQVTQGNSPPPSSASSASPISAGVLHADTQLYYHIEIMQQPIQARAMGWGSKADSRRPVDPPPVINLHIKNTYNELVTHEITNNFILHASLKEVNSDGSDKIDYETGREIQVTNRLTGTTVVSLTHLRSPAPGKFFFLLHDLSIRQEGKYKLVFNVFEVLADQGVIKHRASVQSSTITVYSPKTFPGLETSSDLIKEIASQGCRVRVRKESTFKRKKQRHNSTPSLPPQVANSLVSNLALMNYHEKQQYHLQVQQQNALHPSQPQQQQQQMYGSVQYSIYSDQQQQSNYDHYQQPHTTSMHQQQSHSYFEDYRGGLSASQSNGSTPGASQPQQTYNGYFKGYESLLAAAGVSNPSMVPPGHHYTSSTSDPHTLPPTPSTLYDRTNPPASLRNHRSLSYPNSAYPGSAGTHSYNIQPNGRLPVMSPPSPRSPQPSAAQFDPNNNAAEEAGGFQSASDPYAQVQPPSALPPGQTNPPTAPPTAVPSATSTPVSTTPQQTHAGQIPQQPPTPQDSIKDEQRRPQQDASEPIGYFN
ncbi:hypothetical protein TRVA0_016S01354 [Trichomonascus vanleenenianus]|uniref:velvet factor family protein n=1 Tax=Trichomonascus vanleenenianus TaxID=2268995 RepID=UPI003EC9948B